MAVGLSDKNRHAEKEWSPQVESLLPEQKVLASRHLRYESTIDESHETTLAPSCC
jgi:hypothetical protein